LQALALVDKKVYVFGTPRLPERPVRVFLDVESDPEGGHVYLIGMTVARGGTEESFSFWAGSGGQEQVIFGQFLDQLERYEGFVVFCYGSYERDSLRRMAKAGEHQGLAEGALERLVNVLSLVDAHAYFPAYSNGLKDVAACLGCRWTEPDASGLQSVVWRRRWEASGDERLKQALITYNREDCAALGKVVDFFYAVQRGAELPNPSVARAEDLQPHPDRRSWGAANFVLPEFAELNEPGNSPPRCRPTVTRRASRIAFGGTGRSTRADRAAHAAASAASSSLNGDRSSLRTALASTTRAESAPAITSCTALRYILR
jgi:hypothetical protein